MFILLDTVKEGEAQIWSNTSKSIFVHYQNLKISIGKWDEVIQLNCV